MSTKALLWAVRMAEERQLSPAQFYVLAMLADHHNPASDTCFPSQDLLCKRTGLSERMVRYQLTSLVNAGLIEVERRQWPRRGNVYRLTLSDRQPIAGVERQPIAGDCTKTQETGCRSTGSVPEVRESVTLNVCNPSMEQTTSTPEGVKDNPEVALSATGSSATEVITESVGEVKIFSDVEEAPVPSIADTLAKDMAPKTVEGVLADFANSRAQCKHVTASALGKLWRDLYSISYPKSFQPEMTKKHLGQLKAAYKLAGEAFVRALPRVVGAWADFVLYARSVGVETGQGSSVHLLPTPSIGFVLAHVKLVVEFDQAAAPAPKPAVKKPYGPTDWTPPYLTKKPGFLQTVEKLHKIAADSRKEAASEG